MMMISGAGSEVQVGALAVPCDSDISLFIKPNNKKIYKNKTEIRKFPAVLV
jgi:hypothetical protein